MPSPLAAPGRRILAADTPVQFCKGIGPRRAEQLAAHDIRTVAELLEYPPFRYEDRTSFRPLSRLAEGEWGLARGVIRSVQSFDTPRRRLSIVELRVRDASGEARVKFFNQPYLRTVCKPGMTIILYGQVRRDVFRGGEIEMVGPEWEIVHEEEHGPSVHSGCVVPVYRKVGEMRSRLLRQIIHGVLATVPSDLPDPLPAYLRRTYRLPGRGAALASLHFPELRASTAEARAKEMEALNSGLSPAHKRMIFEELFLVQVGIRLARQQRIGVVKDRRLRLGELVRDPIRKILPFHPTAAQKRVLKEIADDLCAPRPMSRLLQGDVGSGKTIVAAQAAIIVVENGYQVAFMAPTEILAEQHYLTLRRLLAPLDYDVTLLTGSLRPRERREARARIASGGVRIAVGTHALIQEGVEFSKLALVIIDEQHRFGVVQRKVLGAKGARPDMLVMTATPIPRSLALTLYGDLDVSVIDELPPGRKPIETIRLGESARRSIYDAVRATVARGEQVYVVYPLVEESEKSDLRAATAMARRLADEELPDLRIGLLHGQLKSAEKERVMSAFARGEIDVLVATTVIEVGVDVPNATLMVVEHAERFGLAQLHQLRGRVGRGGAASRCVLIAGPDASELARRRLDLLCETSDGFRIAEADLELRGPGEVIGTRQSGIPAFKFANLVRDRKALEVARAEAERFLDRAHAGRDPECRRTIDLVRRMYRDLTLIG